LDKARIFEVGPRDGLQNEKEFIQTEDKIELIGLLASSGLSFIEATSFVNPKWIPQLADAADVARLLPQAEGVHYRVRGYVSTVFGCPYEGEVALESVVRVTEELFKMGVYEVSLGDTIGVATPKQVKDRLTTLVGQFSKDQLAGHFHDTRGTGLANVYASLEVGLRNFDSAIGGLGGCPYAPGASGNISTEDLVYMLEGMGVFTGVDLEELVKAGAFVQNRLGRSLPSKVLSAKLAQCESA